MAFCPRVFGRGEAVVALPLLCTLLLAGPAWTQEVDVPRTRTLSGLTAPAFPYVEPEAAGVSSETMERLGDEIVEWIAGDWHYDGDLVGAELLIVKNGSVVLHEAYGWSDREARRPVQRNSIWSVKSMSKPVTATAVLMLHEEGKLSLDDPVSRYIPTFPDDRTSIRHLLSHTSGYSGEGDDYDWTSLQSLVEGWAEAGAGENWGTFQYSDFNYAALGYIVGAASGTPIDRFTEERILGPLGLVDTSTGILARPVWRARLNPWYRWNEQAGQYDLRWPADRDPWEFYNAAWGMFSTALDYATFMAAWLNGGEWKDTRLLSGQVVEEALQPHGAVDEAGVYGYGWFVDDILPQHGRSFSHGGGDGTLAMGFPADDVIVVYMTHSRGGHHEAALINRIVRSGLVTHPGFDPDFLPLVWEEGATLNTPGLSADHRAGYVGTFRSEGSPAMLARVWEDSGRLRFGYAPEGVEPDLRYDLVPVSEHRFALGYYASDGRVAVTLNPTYRVHLGVENGVVRSLEVTKGDEIWFKGLQTVR